MENLKVMEVCQICFTNMKGNGNIDSRQLRFSDISNISFDGIYTNISRRFRYTVWNDNNDGSGEHALSNFSVWTVAHYMSTTNIIFNKKA